MLIFLSALFTYFRFVMEIPSSNVFVSDDVILFTRVVLVFIKSTASIATGFVSGFGSSCLGGSGTGVYWTGLSLPQATKKTDNKIVNVTENIDRLDLM